MKTLKILIGVFWVIFAVFLSTSHAENSLDKIFKGVIAELSQSENATPAVKRIVPLSQLVKQYSFSPLVKQVAPAVVNVYAARKTARRSPFEGDPFFERFFGRHGLDGRRPKKRVQRSLGSGVIVGTRGIVVTNYHVIKGATEIKVALSNGREYKCKILLSDEKSDLAILRIQSDEKFPKVTLGNSESLEVGDIVLAIGNPFGVGQTVTSGIVSALARPSLGKGDFGFFIQTDASINPGNSGGALVDMHGRLVGINTAIFSRSGGSNGIGFAIPSNMVEVILRSAASGSKKLIRPWIGAEFQNLTSDIAESLGMRQPRGALITGVSKNSPAEKAGLRPGDVVLKVNGGSVQHVDALGYRLATVGIGREAVLEVLSRSSTKEISILLAKAPDTIPRDERFIKGRSPFSGATVANLSPALAREIGLRGSVRGVVVLSIRRGSTANRLGLRPRDIVRQVNGKKVKSARQLAELTSTRARVWKYTLDRGGRMIRQVVR
jgi:Do/DeqQ family serine protease